MSTPKQGIQLKQTQQLGLTPQLKQSLNILLFNQQELALEINQMLDKNIMLESSSDDDFIYEGEDDYQASEDIPEQLDDIDIEWQDIYDLEFSEKPKKREQTQEFQSDWVADSPSFDQRLETAIQLSGLNEEELKLAEFILQNLDENYFLNINAETIAKQTKQPIKMVIAVIDCIKHLDPSGVASSNIAECLLAQLQVLANNDEPYLNAHEIIQHYFSYLGEKPQLIQSRMGINEQEYDEAILVIRRLSPYPAAYNELSGQNIKPDIFVREKMGMYYASANTDVRFDIGINQTYTELISQTKGDEKTFLKSQLQEANWFIQALDKRNQTILRVANAIVMQQQEFFLLGTKGIKPLAMQYIAELLDISESTVSRSVNGKYLSFNHKLIELRYFFSQELSKKEDTNDEGEGLSTLNIKQIIQTLIDTENKDKPLSDTAIEKTLKLQHINIARRTISKYRKLLGIPSTGERRKKKQ